METKSIYLPYSIERNTLQGDVITISELGMKNSKTFTETEAAYLVAILLKFLNKKDLKDEN